jgi:hypothetical protein
MENNSKHIYKLNIYMVFQDHVGQVLFVLDKTKTGKGCGAMRSCDAKIN